MKRVGSSILLCAMVILFGVPIVVRGQAQIPNGDFEAWTTPPLATYEEPSGTWWATLNTLKSLGGPATVEKTSDAHGGSFAAVLTTRQWGTLTIPGLVVSGDFDIQNPSFLVQGQPFTSLPQSFKGWFKYSPVGGDSAGLAALLTRWNTASQKRDTLAQAAWVVTTAYASWTAFDLPFTYFQSGQSPDSILVALVSSGDGQNFNGQIGSTLWIDDISLDYATAANGPAGDQTPVVQMLGERLSVSMPQASFGNELRIFNLQGQLLHTHTLKTGPQEFALEGTNGVVLLEIRKGNTVQHRQKVVCIRP